MEATMPTMLGSLSSKLCGWETSMPISIVGLLLHIGGAFDAIASAPRPRICALASRAGAWALRRGERRRAEARDAHPTLHPLARYCARPQIRPRSAARKSSPWQPLVPCRQGHLHVGVV